MNFRRVDLDDVEHSVLREGGGVKYFPLFGEDIYPQEVVHIHYDRHEEEWVVFVRDKIRDSDLGADDSWGAVVLTNGVVFKLDEDIRPHGVQGRVDMIISAEEGVILHLGPYGKPWEEGEKKTDRWGLRCSPLLYDRSLFLFKNQVAALLPEKLVQTGEGESK